MRIFVTGANGFIGRAFCRVATARGHQVLGLCRGANTTAPLECQTVTGSLEDPPWNAIEQFQPEAALHLAWIATPGVYLDSSENDVLVTQSQALFRGLAKRGVRYLAGTGTCIEYAASPDPMLEMDSPLNPTFPYSRAKAALSTWLLETEAALGVRSSWFRIFYPYGVGEHPNRLPTLIIRKLAARQPMALRTPDSIKDYVHVEDLAVALCLAIEAGVTGPVNLGSGTGVSITHLAKTIADILGVDAGLVTRADPLTPDPWPIQIADVTRLRKLGWKPATDLRTGLRTLAEALMCAPS